MCNGFYCAHFTDEETERQYGTGEREWPWNPRELASDHTQALSSCMILSGSVMSLVVIGKMGKIILTFRVVSRVKKANR